MVWSWKMLDGSWKQENDYMMNTNLPSYGAGSTVIQRNSV